MLFILRHEVDAVNDVLDGVPSSTPGYENIAKMYGSNAQTFAEDGLVYT